MWMQQQERKQVIIGFPFTVNVAKIQNNACLLQSTPRFLLNATGHSASPGAKTKVDGERCKRDIRRCAYTHGCMSLSSKNELLSKMHRRWAKSCNEEGRVAKGRMGGGDMEQKRKMDVISVGDCVREARAQFYPSAKWLLPKRFFQLFLKIPLPVVVHCNLTIAFSSLLFRLSHFIASILPPPSPVLSLSVSLSGEALWQCGVLFV